MIRKEENETIMTNGHYMALEDFKTLWDDKLKPAIPGLTEYASVATCESIIDELT